MKTIVTVVGARPQFIKASTISRKIRNSYNEYLVHTGQHYDANMSDVFFSELKIPQPDINLGVGSDSHAKQIAQMMIKLEEVLNEIRPSLVLIYGDTNSTMATALTAAKLLIPIAHVESGLRNFDMTIQEEINRVIADRLSTLLFAPTQTAVDNLKAEGFSTNVFLTGDVMYDSLLFGLERAESVSEIVSKLRVIPNDYCLVTIHRAENTDNVQNLANIIKALASFNETVVFPVHPRTRKVIDQAGIIQPDNVKFIQPVGYLDFIMLEAKSRIIVTDSGGVQREAYCLKKPCITIFPTTPWVETVQDGWNKLADASVQSITDAYRTGWSCSDYGNHFGEGNAADIIIEKISRNI